MLGVVEVSMRSVVALVLLVWSGLASAAGWETLHNYMVSVQGSGSGVVTTAGTQSTADIIARRSYVSGGSGWSPGVILKDLLDKPMSGPKNPTNYAPGAIQRVLSSGAIARGVARAVPIVGAAALAIELADYISAAGCRVSEAGIRCEGQYVPDGTATVAYCHVNGGICFRELAQALSYHAWLIRSTGQYQHFLVTNCQADGDFPPPDASGTALRDFYCEIKQWYQMINGQWVRVGDGRSARFFIAKVTGPQTAVKKCDRALDTVGACAYLPTEQEFEAIAESKQSVTVPRQIEAAKKLDQLHRIPMPTGDPLVVNAPSVIEGGRESTTTHPDGSVTVIDRDWSMKYPTAPDPAPRIEWAPVDRTYTYPPGTTVPPYQVGGGTQPPGTTTTTVTYTAPPKVEVITCGLPTTPPCKIDEAGTPSAPGDTSTSDATGVWSALKACVSNPVTCVPALPPINWAFSLPSACSVIPLPAFAPFLTSVDLCQFQPTIHDLMSMLWVAAGLFGGVRLLWQHAHGGA